MQKETRNLLLTAVGAFFSGVIITFLILCLAVSMTRPCHKGMGPEPMCGRPEQRILRPIEMQNHMRGLHRTPHIIRKDKAEQVKMPQAATE